MNIQKIVEFSLDRYW